MILVALMPYTDIILDFFIDTKTIKLNAFNNLSVAIWTSTVCIQPTLVTLLLAIVKLKPLPIAYIVLLYVNLSMLLGFVFLELNVELNSDIVFRIIVLILVLLLYLIGISIKKLWRKLFLEERIDNELEQLDNYGN